MTTWMAQRAAAAAVLAITLAGPANARADHVQLSNGDSLTGSITAVSSTELTMDTELAGRVTLKWTVLSSVTATTAVRATMRTGQTVEGVPVMTDARLSIQGAAGAATPIDLSAVDRLDLAKEPAGGPTWHGAVNAGVDVTRGNSETSTVSTNAAITRLGLKDRLGLFGTYLFSGIGSGANAVTTARNLRAGARYDHDVAGPMFLFGFGDVENDPLQLLDLRTVVGGGSGAHLVKTDATQLNLFGGVSYAKDSYADVTTTTDTPAAPVVPPGHGGTPPGQSGNHPGRGGAAPSTVRTSLSRELGELLFGQDLSHQLSDNVSLVEALTVFPAIRDMQDYRVSFDLSLSAQINGWLQWNVTVGDRYLNIPPAGGAVQNDTFVSTGLGITFGHVDPVAYTGSERRQPQPPHKQ